nr:unnamed protein product [Haemonchus contortus]
MGPPTTRSQSTPVYSWADGPFSGIVPKASASENLANALSYLDDKASVRGRDAKSLRDATVLALEEVRNDSKADTAQLTKQINEGNSLYFLTLITLLLREVLPEIFRELRNEQRLPLVITAEEKDTIHATALLHVILGRIQVLALVDTGASITIASTSTAPLSGVFKLFRGDVGGAVGMAGAPVTLLGCASLAFQGSSNVVADALSRAANPQVRFQDDTPDADDIIEFPHDLQRQTLSFD